MNKLKCIGTVLLMTAVSDARTDESKNILRITPVEFFSGELKRLKNHVDFGTGAVCPSDNLAREAATLSLVTRNGACRCVDPVGETA